MRLTRVGLSNQSSGHGCRETMQQCCRHRPAPVLFREVCERMQRESAKGHRYSSETSVLKACRAFKRCVIVCSWHNHATLARSVRDQEAVTRKCGFPSCMLRESFTSQLGKATVATDAAVQADRSRPSPRHQSVHVQLPQVTKECRCGCATQQLNKIAVPTCP